MSRKRRPPRLTRDEAEFEGELTALRLRLSGDDPGEFGLPDGSPLPAALAEMLSRPARRGQLYRLWLRLSERDSPPQQRSNWHGEASS